jgi:hypothetical protein
VVAEEGSGAVCCRYRSPLPNPLRALLSHRRIRIRRIHNPVRVRPPCQAVAADGQPPAEDLKGKKKKKKSKKKKAKMEPGGYGQCVFKN